MVEPLERRQHLTSVYHLSFDDEFNGPNVNLSQYTSQGWEAAPNTFGWLSRDSGDNTYYSGNHEAQYYANPSQDPTGYNPYSISSGILSLTAQSTTSAGMAGVTSQPYVSGEITSAIGGEQYNFGKGFSQEYGYFEMRCQVPSGPGMWPAFWLLPEPNLNPYKGNSTDSGAEYDIFEIPTNTPSNGSNSPGETLNTTQIQQTAHYWNTSGVYTGTGQTYALPSGGDASTAFHTYGFEWDANSIRWYVDGVLTQTQTFANGTWDTPMYILANLAVGGVNSWPGEPTSSSEFPASFKIDYIRVYSDESNVPEIAGQSGYSVDADTLDAITVDPEPATGGAVLVGLIYLAGRRPTDRGGKRSIHSAANGGDAR